MANEQEAEDFSVSLLISEIPKLIDQTGENAKEQCTDTSMTTFFFCYWDYNMEGMCFPIFT